MARRSIVGIVPIAALAVTTGCWPQAGFNAAGTNHNTSETALTVDNVAALAPAWSAPGHTTAVVGDVYAVSASGWAFPDQAWARASALDPSDGHPVWTTTLSSPGATDAVAGGSAVVGDQLWVTWGELRCPQSGECTSLARGARLDRRTGAVLGVAPPGPDLVPFGNLVASIRACSPETCSSPLTVVDADTGNLVWRPAAGLLGVSTGATVAGGMLYATAGTRIHAFAAQGCGTTECSPVRTYDVGDTGFRVVAGPDGTLLVGASELIALDVASGAVRWRGDLLASPVAMAVTATSVYVVGWGRLEAFDLDGCATGFCSPVWVSSPWEVPTQAPGLIAVAGGVVYAQTDAFHVGAYAADGCGELFCPPIADIHVTQVGGLLVSGGRLIIGRVPLDRNQATIEVYALA